MATPYAGGIPAELTAASLTSETGLRRGACVAERLSGTGNRTRQLLRE